MKISVDRPNKAFSSQPVGLASRPSPLSCVGWASSPSSLFSQPATHSPAFGQSHAAERPDRP
ncbi:MULTISPECIES: hypothetical protein [unclassified Microcoleus]|uniref:hypothetical protein n=1 Tax=unclassified Microcoleus TaxID=2642155 RepID=UPI002FCF82ED